MDFQQKNSGFTLIELMLVLAILCILALIVLPVYQDYLRKTRYSEFSQLIASYKIPIVECIHQNGMNPIGCDGGTNSIPANIMFSEGNVQMVIVVNGVITITPNSYAGITPVDTLVATPMVSPSKQSVQWTLSGPAVDKGWVKF